MATMSAANRRQKAVSPSLLSASGTNAGSTLSASAASSARLQQQHAASASVAAAAKFPAIDFVASSFALEWKLIQLLKDYDALRKPWFLQPGENHANQTKQSAGRALAPLLLKDTPLATYAVDSSSEGAKIYGARIVQKLDQARGRGLSFLYQKVKKELKITGNGVKDASQLSDASANIWEEQKKVAPWFFEFAALVGGRLSISDDAISNSSASAAGPELSSRLRGSTQCGREASGSAPHELNSAEDGAATPEKDYIPESEKDGAEEDDALDPSLGEEMVSEDDGGIDVYGADGEDDLPEAEADVEVAEVQDSPRTDDHGAKRTRDSSAQDSPSKRIKPLDMVMELARAKLDAQAAQREALIAHERQKEKAEVGLEREKQETEKLKIARLQLELRLREMPARSETP